MFFLIGLLLRQLELQGILEVASRFTSMQSFLAKLNNLTGFSPSMKKMLYNTKLLQQQTFLKRKRNFSDVLNKLKPDELKELNQDLQKLLQKLSFKKSVFRNLTDDINQYIKQLKPNAQPITFKEEELKGVPIDVIVPLSSSWVSSAIWIPVIKRGLGGNWIGTLKWDTKNTPGKYYITPNFTSSQWEDIRLNWTSPQPKGAPIGSGHGAGSYLWEYNLLRKAGYNPSKVASRFKERIKSGKYGVKTIYKQKSLSNIKSLQKRLK